MTKPPPRQLHGVVFFLGGGRVWARCNSFLFHLGAPSLADADAAADRRATERASSDRFATNKATGRAKRSHARPHARPPAALHLSDRRGLASAELLR